jgi:hypothetical protein
MMEDGDREVMLFVAAVIDDQKMGRDTKTDTWPINDWLGYDVSQKAPETILFRFRVALIKNSALKRDKLTIQSSSSSSEEYFVHSALLVARLAASSSPIGWIHHDRRSRRF